MTLDIPYDKSVLQVTLPESIDLINLELSSPPRPKGVQELIKESLESPVSGMNFSEFKNQEGSLLVIVNDGTRPTPTRFILEELADQLDSENTRFMIATGVHRGPTEEEYRFIFGTTYERFKDRILVHDARRSEELVFLGTSDRGTPIYLNEHCVNSEKVLVIVSVEPHYFAGYTGGRKGFFPGIAGFETIEANHKMALDPAATSLNLAGNPVHDDMMDCLKVISHKKVFSLMTVLDKEHQIYALSSGDIAESLYAAVDKANEIFLAPAEKKADIVISCAKYPMDVDLYQTQKAIDNGKLALKKGGTMFIVSSCHDGLGEKAFTELLSSSDTPEGVLSHIGNEFTLGYHKAAKMAEVFTWADVRMVSTLEDETVSKLFMTPVHDLQAALDQLIQEKGDTVSLIYIPDGCVTVPSVS